MWTGACWDKPLTRQRKRPDVGDLLYVQVNAEFIAGKWSYSRENKMAGCTAIGFIPGKN